MRSGHATRVYALWGGFAWCALVVSPLLASPLTFGLDFGQAEHGILLGGSASLHPNGGLHGSGFLSLHDQGDDALGLAVLDGLKGVWIQGFDLSAVVRIGAGDPGDGFSISVASAEDPALMHFAQARGEGNAHLATAVREFAEMDSPVGGPAEGTTTGLSFGFDETSSSASDVVGLSIRLDDELLAQIELGSPSQAPDDPAALPTGASERPDELDWVEFRAKMDPATDELTVWWKNSMVFEQMIPWTQIPNAAFVFAGSSGDGNSVNHIESLTFSELELPRHTCDIVIDGDCDQHDVDFLLYTVIPQNRLLYDLNDSGTVDLDDVQTWLDLAQSLPGDANLDGRVNFLDFIAVSTYYETEARQGQGWGHGDFDGSGRVTFLNFITLSTHFGQSARAFAVPEPHGFIGLVMGLSALLSRRTFVARPESRG